MITLATGTDRHIRCNRLHLMEVIAAIGLLAIVMTGTFSGLHANRSFRRKLAARAEALLILDNVLERASALPAPSPRQMKAILAEETGKSALSSMRGLQAVCDTNRDGFRMRIAVAGSPPLAEVRMPLK